MTNLDLVHIAYGMVELHGSTLVQVSLGALQHVRSHTGQTVHRLIQIVSLSWGRHCEQARPSKPGGRSRDGALELRHPTMILLLSHGRRTRRSLLFLLCRVAVVVGLLMLTLVLLPEHAGAHHA